MNKVIVQLGNPSDTSGASIEMGVLFHTREEMFTTVHFIVTKKGIALAEKQPLGWYYSTACLPLSYGHAIESNWEINIPAEIEEMMATAKTLEHGMKSSALLTNTIAQYAFLYAQRVGSAGDADFLSISKHLTEKHGEEKANHIIATVTNKASANERIVNQLSIMLNHRF